MKFLTIFGGLFCLCFGYVYTLNPHAFDRGAVAIAQAMPAVQSALLPPAGDDVRGSPTVSAQFIDQVLCTYPLGNHSPACGTGQNIYDMGVHY